MKDAKYYSITAVAKRFNIPYNTVWTYDKNLKMGKYSSFKTIDRALRLVRTNVSDAEGEIKRLEKLNEGKN